MPDSSALPLPLTMLIVFGAAKLLAELFENLNQPGLVGEILAGLIIGPSLLGWIHADALAPGGLLGSLADLGVMFLLFRVGLEVKASELVRIGGTAALVAASGVVFSLVLVWGVLALWGIHSLEAMFVSASLAATSVGITAQVLSARGLLSRKSSQIILAAAVLDDVCGLLVLAVVSGSARGSVSVAAIATTVLLAGGFVVVVAAWGPWAVKHARARTSRGLRLAEAEFAVSMCLLFGLSVFSLYTGIAAVVGAFLAGLALSASAGERVRTLVHGATELLVPFFLAGIGLRVDITALGSPAMLALAGGLLAAAVAAKVGGCGLGMLAMFRRGRGWQEAFQVGAGMIPRGEVTMVIAQLGLATGAITGGVYGVVVAVAVATTLIAPPLIKLAFQGRAPD